MLKIQPANFLLNTQFTLAELAYPQDQNDQR